MKREDHMASSGTLLVHRLLSYVLTDMTTDETGAACLGSDHCRLTLEFGENIIRQSSVLRTLKGLTRREMELKMEAENEPVKEYTDVLS